MPGLVYEPLNVAKNEIRVLRVVHDVERPSYVERLGTTPVAVPKFSMHNVSLDDFTDESRVTMARLGKVKITPKDHIEFWRALATNDLYPEGPEHTVSNSPSDNSTTSDQRVGGRWRWGDFRTISYVWGKSTASRKVMVNDCMVEVTDNLFDVLEYLWLEESLVAELARVAIWVDALCINQQAVEERNLQVRRMGDIYGQAFQKIGWVSNGNGRSQRGAAFVKFFANEIRNFHRDQCSGEDAKITRSFLERALVQRQIRGFGAFLGLIYSDYWTRLWILQEVTLAENNIVFIYHGFGVSRDDLNVVLRSLTSSWSTAGLVDYLQSRLPDVANHQDFRYNFMFGLVCMAHTLSTHARLESVIPIMQAVTKLQQSDLKDKVYGILSLLPPALSRMISPDYEKPVPTVFYDFVKAVIMQTNRLDILSITRPRTERDPGLLTWIPDLGPNREIELSLKGDPYSASGDAHPQIDFQQYMVLSAEGFVFDFCESLANDLRDVAFRVTKIEDLDIGEEIDTGTLSAYGTAENVREALWRTMVADRSIDGGKPPPAYEALLHVPWRSRDLDFQTMVDDRYSSLYEVLRRMNCGLSIGGVSLREYYATPEAAQDSSPYQDTMRVARDVAVGLASSYRLTVTQKGYLGLAPNLARKGDKICILLGCYVPLLLRPVGGTEHWRLIGSCYVHGIMDGEAMEWLQDGRCELRKFLIC